MTTTTRTRNTPSKGDRFGCYTIVCKVADPLGGQIKYKAYCDCGKMVIQRLSDIKNNTNGCRRCGCGRKPKIK